MTVRPGAPVGENPPVPPDADQDPEEPGPQESPPGYDPRPDHSEDVPEPGPEGPDPPDESESAEEEQRQD